MEKAVIVEKLGMLRQELEQDRILLSDIGKALLFDDILGALGLDDLEREVALGYRVFQLVEQWRQGRCGWPTIELPATSLVAKTATKPRQEQAAV